MPDELDEMIAAGWGDTPQYLIPKNWREVRPKCATCRKKPRVEGKSQCESCVAAFSKGLGRRQRAH